MNIVLIIPDTFRYDNISGCPKMAPRTPELDRFVQRAVALSRMYVSSFPTIPLDEPPLVPRDRPFRAQNGRTCRRVA